MSYRANRSRTLGLAAIAAVAAMAFIGAASASAAEFHAAESEEARVHATAENNQVFTAGVIGNISCTEATFTGKFQTSPHPTVTVLPEYNNCTFLGVSDVKVNMNGCEYHFDEPQGPHGGPFAGTVDVICPEGKEISFSASDCTVTVPEQHNLSQVTYVNLSTSPKSVTVGSDVTKITYNASGIGCNTLPGEYHDGKYEGAAIATAENQFLEPVDAFVT